MATEISVLTKPQAEKLVKAICDDAQNLAGKLRDFHDRLGWQALGYASWGECVQEEFGYTKRHANRLIEATQVRDRVGQICPTPPPDSHIAELAQLPDDEQADCYKDYLEECDVSGEKTTAAGLREKAATWGSDNEPYEEEEPEEEAEEATPSAEELMAEGRKNLNTLARAITGLNKAAEEADDPWLNERLDILEAHLRTAAGVVRACMGEGGCTYCDGDGCKECLESGWLPKLELTAAPEAKA